MKIDHSWNFRNITSISVNAGDEDEFGDGFDYPKTTCLWSSIKSESHSYFNEAGFTNWERMSIVLSYSVSMRYELFFFEVVSNKMTMIVHTISANRV